jgi:hypothetical protein
MRLLGGVGQDVRVDMTPWAVTTVLLLAFMYGAACWWLWHTRRSRRPRPPADLRRSDDAHGQDAYDPVKATDEAEGRYWRGPGP